VGGQCGRRGGSIRLSRPVESTFACSLSSRELKELAAPPGDMKGRMSLDALGEVRDFWNRVASDWQTQVGEDRDRNRRLNSDPVLRDFAGDASGLDVLDASCGTGYLSRKLSELGAHVVGVDLSDNMVGIAEELSPELDLRVDSVSTLGGLEDDWFDLVVSNYASMDVPFLEETLDAFHRVL